MSDSEGAEKPMADDSVNVTKRNRPQVMKMDESAKLHQENESLKQQIELLQTQRQLQEALIQLRTRTKMPEPREMESLVSKFDPKNPTSLTAEEWVRSIESVARSYNWTEDAMLYCARLQLDGAARLWFEGVRDEVADWRTFGAAIKAGFPSSKGPIHYHNLMQNRCRLSTETIEEFVYCMNAMGKRGGFDEQTIVTYIINGLSMFLSRSKVSVSNTNTVQELLVQLKWIERLQGLASPSTESPRASLPRPPNFEISSGSHLTDSRVKIKKCFRCHQEGHWKRDCPVVRQRSDNGGIKVIQRKSAFVKPVSIGDLNLTALVDTGAKVSTIKQCYARQCGELQPCGKVLQGFGLKQIAVKSLCVTNIVVDQIRLSANFHVVPDYVQEMPIIIGEDIIDQDKLVMIKRGSEVKFQLESEETAAGNKDDCTDDTAIAVYKIEVADQKSEIVAADIKCGGTLAAQNQLLQMMNEYRQCFSKTMKELGVANDAQMQIVLKDAEPVFVKPRKLEYTREAALSEIVADLVEAGIIEETNSPYNSPVVLVPKKDKQFRMAVDFRQLNAKTIKDRFPMPDIESCLNKLAGGKVFISVDLYSGYYQIPLAPDSRDYTAFSTKDGHFRFRRMPFGLVNGCAVFQRTINKILSQVKNDGVVGYIDDLIIAGEVEEELLEKFRRLLEVLKKSGLTINLKKSQFFERTVLFLGFEVSQEGVKPGSQKTEAVQRFPTPTSVRQVQQFIGLSGFFRRFVKGYSIIAAPLYKLLKKDAVFEWKHEQQQSFETIKSILSSRPLLVLFDPSRDLELHTDASSVGLAAVLLMKMDEGLKPLSYFSRKTNEDECRYHSYELEMLAVVTSVERFRYYLLGRKFVIKTDCSAVKDAYKKKDINHRIARYFLKLLEYDFVIEYRPGASMAHVDALSRNPVGNPDIVQSVEDNIMLLEISNGDALVSMQRRDPKLVKIVSQMEGVPESDEQRQIQENYVLENHRLYRKLDGRKCWVVPANIRWRLLKHYHDDYGHFGEEKVLQLLVQKFWFPRMRKYTQSYIKACPGCAFAKEKGGRPEGLLHPIPKFPVPFQTIHLDHLGPFPRSSRGNVHLLVIICGFSKFILAKPVKSTKSAPVIAMLRDMVAIFGSPGRIITDRGTAFTSRVFAAMCRDLGVHHSKVAVGAARGNGQVERSNRTILNSLRSLIDPNDRKWDEEINNIQWAINNSPNSTTGCSPSSLLLSYTPRDIHRNEIVLAIHDEGDNRISDPAQIKARAAQRILLKQQAQKRYFDQRRRGARGYQIGDLVLVEKDQFQTSGSHKLEPRYKGPYIVAGILGNDRYQVESLPERSERRFSTVYSADRIKPWCELPDLELLEEMLLESNCESSDESTGDPEENVEINDEDIA